MTGAEIRLEHTLRIFSIHCPAGEGGYVRTMHRVLDAIAPLRKRGDLVLGGDFNVAAGYRGADEPVRMSTGERELLDRITGEFNLVACWQSVHAGQPLAQTLRWTANRIAPYHCDGVFVPRSWQPKLRSCDILSGEQWEQLSDHNPVVAGLDVKFGGDRGRSLPNKLVSGTQATQT